MLHRPGRRHHPLPPRRPRERPPRRPHPRTDRPAWLLGRHRTPPPPTRPAHPGLQRLRTGWSDRIPGPYDLDLFRRQLAELLDATGAGPRPRPRPHIVGASMGAPVALALLTAPHTPRPASLTLSGPAGFTAPDPLLSGLLSRPALARQTGIRLGQRLLARHTKNNVRTQEDARRLSQLLAGPAAFDGTVHAVLTTLRDTPLHGHRDLYRAAAALHVPTLLLWRRHDNITPVTQLPTVEELLAPQKVLTLDGHGHMLPFEAPATTAGPIADFAAENPPPP
ncbi:alpha/beta hydrolase [Streptomyces parvus]|uniref:alpha/beta fold hydrolase n=1 Tax=Streptomyces parvus TaxID=66428 RepID=UPI0033E4A3C8